MSRRSNPIVRGAGGVSTAFGAKNARVLLDLAVEAGAHFSMAAYIAAVEAVESPAFVKLRMFEHVGSGRFEYIELSLARRGEGSRRAAEMLNHAWGRAKSGSPYQREWIWESSQ